MANPSDHLLLFLHIPRTGGTSLWSIFNEYYGRKRVIRVIEGDIEENDVRIKELLENHSYDYDVIGGHMSHFGLHTYAQRKTYYVTMLRAPADVTLSRYYKIVRKESKELHDLFVNEFNNDIEKALDYMGQDKNYQTRQLAGVSQETPTTQVHLEQAKTNLQEHFISVGIVERSEESLHVLRRRNKWNRFIGPAYRNRGANRPREIPQNIYDIINSQSQYDLELLDFANDLLTQQVRKERPLIYFDMAKHRITSMIKQTFSSQD